MRRNTSRPLSSNSRSYGRHLLVQEYSQCTHRPKTLHLSRTSPSCPLQPVPTLPEFQFPQHYDFPDSCQCKTKLFRGWTIDKCLGYLFQMLWISERIYKCNWTNKRMSCFHCGIILNRYAESPWLKIIFLMVANDMTSLIFCLIFLKAEIQDWANKRKNTYLWWYKVLTLDETLAPLRPSYLPWNLVFYYLKMKCVLLCQDFYLQNGDNKTYFLELLSVRNSRYRNQSLSSHTINWSCYYNY